MRRAAFVRTAVAAAERLSRNLEYGGGCFLRGEGWKDRIQAYRFNTGGHFYRRRYLISHRVIKVHNVHPGYIQAYCHRKKSDPQLQTGANLDGPAKGSAGTGCLSLFKAGSFSYKRSLLMTAAQRLDKILRAAAGIGVLFTLNQSSFISIIIQGCPIRLTKIVFINHGWI